MNDLVIATTEADAAAVAAVEQHHAELAGALALRVQELVRAAAAAAPDGLDSAALLVDWCERELVPHARAEEQAMYPAAQARPEGRLLVEGMLAEHSVITGLVREIAAAREPVAAAAAARALQVLFEAHLAKENDLVLPLLAAAPDVSVADLLAGMHELLGGGEAGGHAHEHGHEETGVHRDAAEEPRGCGGHTCSCGEQDAPGYPELDARAVPHAIRHATIFGALDAVPAGGGLVLVAPHDPVPLLDQVEQRTPGRFTVDYLERGPEAWRLAFVRG